jgi:hypothetical protein
MLPSLCCVSSVFACVCVWIGGIWLGGIDIDGDDGKFWDMVFSLVLVMNFFIFGLFVSSIREWDGSGMFLVSFNVVRRICQYIHKVGKELKACTISPTSPIRERLLFLRFSSRKIFYLNTLHTPAFISVCLLNPGRSTPDR